MHVINYEWNRSMFVTSAMCFVWDTKPDLPIETRVRDEGMNNDNDAWGMRDKWENEVQS